MSILSQVHAMSRGPEAYIPHTPTSQQQAFLGLESKEALYGGAAGGGKSDALLMAALQYVTVPGYSAILFRRTFQDLSLPGSLIPRSHEWLAGTDARWDGSTRTWRFPASAKLTFGYLDTAMDHFRYQSAEFQFVGFDELTQFAEAQYLYMFSRLRRASTVGAPLRMRAGSNPGGIGHAWVKRRFVNAKTRAVGADFVPARVRDNPHLKVDEYVDSLMHLDSVTRARYLEGDWDVSDDMRLVYAMFDRDTHMGEPPSKDPAYYRLVVAGLDPGLRDPYAVGVWGLDWDGHWWGLDEFYRTGCTSASLGKHLMGMQEKWAISRWYVDKRRPSDIADLRRAGIHAVPNLDVHAENDRDTIRPMIAVVYDLMRAGRITISPKMIWHAYEFENYQYKDADARNAGEVPVDKDNHAMDAARYCICSVAELPKDRRPRYRAGSDLTPKARGRDPRRRPDERVPMPTAAEYLQAQEARFNARQRPGRRQRT